MVMERLEDGASRWYATEHGRLFNGDCLEFLKGQSDETVDLAFADPPFNLGKDYGGGISDVRPPKDYRAWSEEWIDEMRRLLKPGGALVIFNIPVHNISNAHYLLSKQLEFRHWIAVDIKNSPPIQGKLITSHHSLIYFTNGKPRTFQRPKIPIATCRHCGGDIKDYGGYRKKISPTGLNLSDVWTDIHPIRHKSAKNRSANQLSSHMMKRVIEMTTVPGDHVLDPFGGSGTTYVVAEQLHRRWSGSELGDVQAIASRFNGEAPDFCMPQRGDRGRQRR